MKYRRSDYAKYATLASLALALTLVAGPPVDQEASSSFTPAASEEVSIPAQPPAGPTASGLSSPEVSAPSQDREPAEVTVTSPAVVTPALAAPVRQAPVSTPAEPTAPAEPAVPAPQESLPNPVIPSPATVPAPSSTVANAPAPGSCIPANIDIQRQDQVRAIKPISAEQQQYYTVLGCAEGWLAYSISDEGIKAIGLDGGNSWYNVGKLQANGRYLTDFGQLWASVYNWESHSLALQNNPNNKFATVQEAMDQEFADKGIPVRLRSQLVGAGPAAGACTVANIDIQRNDTVRAIQPISAENQPYYTVLGCAEGWVAYSISDDGIRAMGLDGGNAWYNVGKLQANGRYLTDFGQLWASVYNWESHSLALQNNPNNKFATVQEAMDAQFATNGIPVRLRPQLVGTGPAAA